MAREKKTSTQSTNDRREKKDYPTAVVEEYEIGNVKDIHEALKDLLGGTIKAKPQRRGRKTEGEMIR